MTPALLRLLLVFATLHAQTPCAVVFAAVGPSPRPAANTPPEDTKVAPVRTCPCCRGSTPVADRPPMEPLPDRAPGGCPVDCPCMFCSPGFVPLTAFGCVTLLPDTASEPPLMPPAPTGGHAGHRQHPDRPPRHV